MLDHLHIQNYRLFKDLKIDKLGQVNLIAGKNNTGKTALLEIIWLCENNWEDNLISYIIDSRGDLKSDVTGGLYSLFSEKENSNVIKVSVYDKENNRTYEFSAKDKIRYNILNLKIYQDDLLEFEGSIKIVYNYELSLNLPCIWLPLGTELNSIQNLWNLISLTPEEEEVISIIRIIEPKVSNLRVEDGNAKILLKGEKYPKPLKNLGEGANRLLLIALSLVSSKEKLLLLDEFEVGLHHSVQEQLWDIIFKYAKEWNIQEFVTTHSQDTVKAFAEIWNQSDENIKMGNYFRLQQSRENPELIEPIYYDNEMLEFAYQKHIETR